MIYKWKIKFDNIRVNLLNLIFTFCYFLIELLDYLSLLLNLFTVLNGLLLHLS